MPREAKAPTGPTRAHTERTAKKLKQQRDETKATFKSASTKRARDAAEVEARTKRARDAAEVEARKMGYTDVDIAQQRQILHGLKKAKKGSAGAPSAPTAASMPLDTHAHAHEEAASAPAAPPAAIAQQDDEPLVSLPLRARTFRPPVQTLTGVEAEQQEHNARVRWLYAAALAREGEPPDSAADTERELRDITREGLTLGDLSSNLEEDAAPGAPQARGGAGHRSGDNDDSGDETAIFPTRQIRNPIIISINFNEVRNVWASAADPTTLIMICESLSLKCPVGDENLPIIFLNLNTIKEIVGAFLLNKYPRTNLFDLPASLVISDLHNAHVAYFGEDNQDFEGDNIFDDTSSVEIIGETLPTRAPTAASHASPAAALALTPTAASRAPSTVTPAAAARAPAATSPAAALARTPVTRGLLTPARAPASAAHASPASVAPASPAAAHAPPRFTIPPQEDEVTVDFLPGDYAAPTFPLAKQASRDARRLTPAELELMEIVNHKAALIKDLRQAGVRIPEEGKLALLFHGGAHVGTDPVMKIVCTGCQAELPEGAYIKPDTGRHYHLFCWSVHGEPKNPKCVDIIPYYLKKYMMKNFHELYEQSKRANSADRAANAGRQ